MKKSNLSPKGAIILLILFSIGIFVFIPPLSILIFIIFPIYLIASSIIIVNSQEVAIVERLGKYNKTLEAGIGIIIPFIDRVHYRISLKEIALNVEPQPCFTKDNLRVAVNGILYYKVFDAKKAAYSVENFRLATVALAQTSMRSAIGQMLLDQTFQDREEINRMIIMNLDEASANWGIKVTRYEIQEIAFPDSIAEAMEYQVKAEREKRAVIANSEGEKASKINQSLGQKMQMINLSEAEKMKTINEAEGKAFGIKAVATANAYELKKIIEVLETENGDKSFSLDLASRYIQKLGLIATKDTKIVLPYTLTDTNSIRDQFVKNLLNPKG